VGGREEEGRGEGKVRARAGRTEARAEKTRGGRLGATTWILERTQEVA